MNRRLRKIFLGLFFVVLGVLLVEFFLYLRVARKEEAWPMIWSFSRTKVSSEKLEDLVTRLEPTNSDHEKVYFSGKKDSLALNGQVMMIDYEKRKLRVRVNQEEIELFAKEKGTFLKRDFKTDPQMIDKTADVYISFKEIKKGDYIESIARLVDGQLEVFVLDVVTNVEG